MEFRILGPLEIALGERLLPLRGGRQRALLALLGLHRNEVVAKDVLVEELWPNEPYKSALNTLQATVSRLRKALGQEGGRLRTQAPGYLLRLEPEELDAARFEALLREGRAALAAELPEQAAEALQGALSLWRGPALADVRYERFAQAEIARLEELRLVCLEERLEADLQAGRHSTLVGEIDALVGEHPLRERLRAQHMLALYRSGRQAEALEAYQDARRDLTEGLGIEPSLELRELEKAILQQDASLTPVPATEAPEEAGEAARGAFVGREEELDELLQGFADVVAGRGRLFLLVGEPGIGKSRLADEVLRHARAHGAEALAGRCWEGGGAPAYWPWMQSIREYVRTADSDTLRLQLGSGVTDVAQIIPEVRERLPDTSEPVALESESARFRLFDSTAAFIRNAAAERPWVLVLDDLHAADEPSLLLLRFLAGELAGANVLVVGTYRDVDPTVRDPLASTLSELARERVTRRIHLTGLTKADVARYIELETRAAPSADLARAIHGETEGNPLFVGEVVRLLAAEGNLANVDSRTLSTLGIPQGVREVIGRRLRNLSDEGAGLLALASVLGREFRVDVLERLAELDVNRVLDVLDEAISARLVMPVPGTLGRLRFAHALIRDTLYDDMTTLRRVSLHRRAAEAMEEIYAANPEPHLAELSYHYFEAAPGGDVDKALSYAERAAGRALELLAFEEAARFYELALQVLELKPGGNGAARCEMLLGLGEAQARAGDEAAGSAAFLWAAELARSAGSAEQLARAALGYGGRFVWMVSGMDEKVVPLLDDALRELGEQESALRAKLLARLAGALRDQPEPGRRTELTAQAVNIARRLEDHSALAYALDGWYCAVWGPDNPEDRLHIADELLAVSGEVGDRERKIQGHYYRAVALLELGQVHGAHAELVAMDRVASELRQPAHHWYVEVLRGILELFEGNFEEAERSIATGLEFARTLRSRLSPTPFKLQSMMLQRERGQLDQEIAMMEQSVDEMPTLTVFWCNLASLYAERGRETEAGAILKAVADTDFEVLPDNDKLYGWSLLGEVCSALRDPAHAPRLYELLSPYAGRNVVCHPGCAIGSVSRYLGLLAALLGRFDDASRHFEDALAMNEKMGARPWLAHTQHDYARLLITRGSGDDRAKGEALLATALATYGALGMAGPLTKAESIAAV